MTELMNGPMGLVGYLVLFSHYILGTQPQEMYFQSSSVAGYKSAPYYQIQYLFNYCTYRLFTYYLNESGSVLLHSRAVMLTAFNSQAIWHINTLRAVRNTGGN